MQLYDFYFRRSNGDESLLAKGCSEREALYEIQQYIDSHDIRSFCFGAWEVNGVFYYEVGNGNKFVLKKVEEDAV